MTSSGCLSILLLFGTILTVSSIDKNILGLKHEQNFFKSYTTTWMLKNCFGSEAVEKWQWEAQKFWYECERQVRPFRPNITRATEKYHFASKPFFGFRRTGHLRYHTEISIEVLQCVFDRLNLKLKKDGSVNYRLYKKMLKRSVKMDHRLKHYVFYGIKQCAKTTNCEDHEYLGEEYSDFLKLMDFYRCSMFTRLSGCIKYDIYESRRNYDIRGLGPELSHIPLNAKRMAISVFFANSDLRGPFKYDL